MNDLLFFIIKMFEDVFSPKKFIITLVLGAFIIILISVLISLLLIEFKPKPVIEILIILFIAMILSPLVIVSIARVIDKIS